MGGGLEGALCMDNCHQLWHAHEYWILSKFVKFKEDDHHRHVVPLGYLQVTDIPRLRISNS